MLTSIAESIRLHSQYHLENTMQEKIGKYFESLEGAGKIALTPTNRPIRLTNFVRIGGGISNDVYSFSISNGKKGNLVLKTYSEDIDPYSSIRKPYAYKKDVCRCEREYELLKTLISLNFPVPKAYAYEADSRKLGQPFILMKEEKLSRTNLTEIVDIFAKTLADLHNFKISHFDMAFLRIPKSGTAFAQSWPRHFRSLLSIKSKHGKRMKDCFSAAIQYLDSNSTKNYCARYCLVHGDYHPGNFCKTNDSRFLVLDWDSIEIGDPALDVGYAYHFLKFFSNPENPENAESIAQRFIDEYKRHFNDDIESRLDFYKMVGILGPAIFSSSSVSDPISATKYRRRKFLSSIPFMSGPLILLGLPFIRLQFVARQLAAEGELLWLNYFKTFMSQALENS